MYLLTYFKITTLSEKSKSITPKIIEYIFYIFIF